MLRVAACAGALAGCGGTDGPGATGTVVVGVTSDFAVGADIGSLEAKITASGQAPSTLTWTVGGARQLTFPLELPFADLPDGADVGVLFSAREGTSPDEHPFLTREVATSILEGRTLLLRAHLEWECVPSFHLPGGQLAPDCPPPKTCIAASCEDPLTPPEELADYRPDWAVDYADPCRPEAAGDPTLTIGEGLDSFTPLAGPVLLHPGPQGGYHIWLALRSTNLHQKGSVTTLSVTLDGADSPLCDLEVPWDYTPSMSNACDLAGIQCVVANDIAAANALDTQPALVTAKVRDLTGDVAFATQSLTFTLQPP